MARSEPRPAQHRIGDIAANAVALIWSQTGAAVEHVQQDYGEDILVQPSINGSIDPARIWVQVKGTNAAQVGPRSVPVPNAKLLRWGRLSDFVVLVQWNVRHGRGWFATIDSGTDLGRLMEDPKGTTRIHFAASDVFDIEHAEQLSRQAVLAHADKELLLHQLWEEEDPSGDNDGTTAIIVSTMVSVGILVESDEEPGAYHFDRSFFLDVLRLADALYDKGVGSGDDPGKEAITAAILLKIMEFAPTHDNLLKKLTKATLSLVYSEMWGDAPAATDVR